MTIKYVSFVDVLALPQFQGMRESDLLSRKLDDKVLELFHPVGVDKSKGVCIQASKHRTNSGKIVVNWRYVFMERMDKEWLHSSRSSLEARISSTKDKGLRGELMQMAGILNRVSTDGIAAACEGELAIRQKGAKQRIVPQKDFDEDMQVVTKQILALQAIQKSVRGGLSASEDVLWEDKSSEENLEQDVLEYNQMYKE